MSFLDSLIDKSNKVPTHETYIYNLDMYWKVDTGLESFPIQEGIIVRDVERLANGSFNFTIDGVEGRCRTNYGWAFIANTPENARKFKAYKEFTRKLELLENQRKKMFEDLETLSGKTK